MAIYPNFYQTLLPCPIVELRGYLSACGLKGRLYAYLDFDGPTGTSRDALAEGMLALAAEQHTLAPGQPIIEASTGAFAAALTLASRTAGHPIVIAMPEDAPALRQEYLLRLGAQILHSPARNGLAGARVLAESKAAENGWYYMNWLANDNNPEYHRRVTGPAIAKAIAREGRSLVDSVVVSVGSAGTITGVGETLKAWTNDVRMVAVEPFESQALSGGFTGGHGIPEMGFGFIPKNYNACLLYTAPVPPSTPPRSCWPRAPAVRPSPSSADGKRFFNETVFLFTTSSSLLRNATSPSRRGLGSSHKATGFARGSPARGAVERMRD